MSNIYEEYRSVVAALKQAEVTIRHLGPVDGAERLALDDIQHALSKADAFTPVDPDAVARRIYEDAHTGMRHIWNWDDGGLDDEHPGTRDRYLKYARSAIAVIAA